MLRHIRVRFNDGDFLETNINGTDIEILRYYIGKEFELHDESGTHYAIAVEFLDQKPNRINSEIVIDDIIDDIGVGLDMEDDREKLLKTISEMSPEEALDKYLEANGIIGYTDQIIYALDRLRIASYYKK